MKKMILLILQGVGSWTEQGQENNVENEFIYNWHVNLQMLS